MQTLPKGAVHSAEIEYAFGNLATNEVFAWTADDYKVSNVMQEFFRKLYQNRRSERRKSAGMEKFWQRKNRFILCVLMSIHASELEKNRARYLFLDKF